uniref:Translation factor GUF1 homolog, mitochondrial n=1 Tax=Amorphochlora amoebiformis TaxID=1561963 RepID=A0A7S0D828_9EUKA|mmetsp:Transcript_21329/g.33654  ORF Transcript_21329/g.33654 Transcript_21329/m.33654 type:complete len:724 (+) Transcript_21329:134-2305(+)
MGFVKATFKFVVVAWLVCRYATFLKDLYDPAVRPQPSRSADVTRVTRELFSPALRSQRNNVLTKRVRFGGRRIGVFEPQQRDGSLAVASSLERKITASDVQKDVDLRKKTNAVNADRIRNFCIIAHIDHGKSTLADRLLENTGSVASRDMKAQLLDNMDLERERGITIKLQAARMTYKAKNGKEYVLNLIDTPGHVDFAYEVSRSLAACEGALLVVDAAQGVQAQTLANAYLAINNDLEIIPVLNKIDLPAADPDRVVEEMETTIGLDCTDVILSSAKSGIGIEDILEAVVDRIPPPQARANNPLRALIFDSYYDAFRGVVVFFRVIDGVLRRRDKIRFMASGKEYEVNEVGILTANGEEKVDALYAGEVGYFAASIKQVEDASVGDTIVNAREHAKNPVEALPGYQPATPMVYCGLFPVESDQYPVLRDALGKLKLNDAALAYEPEVSNAMGFGFRCGFLGLLHMEIVQERLEREYDLDLIVTAPSVVYKVRRQGSTEETLIETPSKMPNPDRNLETLEPYCQMEIITPKEYVGALMDLAQTRRGEMVDLKFLTPERSMLVYKLPLAEVITDFFDQMKSRSQGYASMEYSITGYEVNKLDRLDILINGELAPPLSTICHRDQAHDIGKALTRKLKELIPRQQFAVPIQAAIGAKIVAASKIPAVRKDVLAKCYGGDISRKKKLLQKQAKGKKRMKMMGKVNVPQEAFMAVLNVREEGGKSAS